MSMLKLRMMDLEERLSYLREQDFILCSELRNDNWYTPKGKKAKVLNNWDKLFNVRKEVDDIENELRRLGYYNG